MAEPSSLKLGAGDNVTIGGSVLLVLAAMVAAYYTGRTGNPEPLLAISFGLLFFVLFVTSA